MIYVCGSRLGGWYHEKSDIDILVLSSDVKSVIKRVDGLTYDIQFRERLEWRTNFNPRALLGGYNIETDTIVRACPIDVLKYLLLKNREVTEEVVNYLVQEKPCKWFEENKVSIKTNIKNILGGVKCL